MDYDATFLDKDGDIKVRIHSFLDDQREFQIRASLKGQQLGVVSIYFSEEGFEVSIYGPGETLNRTVVSRELPKAKQPE